jgi:hypothetical protein
MRRHYRLLAFLPVVGLAAVPSAAQPPAMQPFDFVAFGDMPYCNRVSEEVCAGEVARVQALTATINAARPAFSIFLGDTKGGSEACTDAVVFDRTLEWMGRIEGPLVYTPGDNEWTDCWQDRAGRHDPIALLRRIRERFFPAAVSLGRAPMPLTRQADVSPAHALFVENARWQRDGVLFATAHVVGSDNNRPPERGAQPPGAAEEWPTRDAANLAWIEEAFALAARDNARAVVIAIQAEIWYRERCGRGTEAGHLATRRVLAEGARRFGKPVLVLHGDSHFYLDDRPVADAPNLRRVMVPGDKDIRAVLVRVTPDAADPFAVSMIGAADRPERPHC